MLSDWLSAPCDNPLRDWMISHTASLRLWREREKVCLFSCTVHISALFPPHSSRLENCYLENNCSVISLVLRICVEQCVCVSVQVWRGVCCHWMFWTKHTAELPNRGGNYFSHAILTKPKVMRMNPVYNDSHTLRPACKTFRVAKQLSDRRRRRVKDMQLKQHWAHREVKPLSEW